uniref:Transposon MuDR mudrA n=1 Tax=Solanum tuberosum TaxID=4113 RepID=M1CP88_SOLTU
MDSYILTCFHHGGCVVGNPNPTYQREVDVFGVGIDKDHFSLVEFLSYTKDLGYTNVKGFYCEDNNELVQVTSDTQLLEFVKDLVDGDEFHVYVVHEVDELEELPAPTGLLPWSDPVDESVGINTEGTVENDSDLNGVDTELPGGDTNQNEVESDLPSSDTDVDVIPDEDDSDVDEELRSLRAERRNKRNPNFRKKKTITKEVPIGEAGVDRDAMEELEKLDMKVLRAKN